jgi:hypothetical protein
MRYSDEVAGVALIDSSHPEQFERLPEMRAEIEQTNRLFAFAPWLARVGVLRVFNPNPRPKALPRLQQAQVDAFSASTRQMSTTAAEFRATQESTAQVRAMDDFGDTPLGIVTAGQQSRSWLELQGELATLSSNSTHTVVDGATHLSLLHTRSDGEVTGAAILEVVEAVRNIGVPAGP